MNLNRIDVIYKRLVSPLVFPVVNKSFLLVLSLVVLVFFVLRLPYMMDEVFFFYFLIASVVPLFLCLFFHRLFMNSVEFFASFIPVGTPLWVAWFVCIAETVSYAVRPLVLIFRPFMNILIGCYMVSYVGKGVLLGGSFSLLILLIVFLFFYEIFVTCVQWFIILNILDYSVVH